jgi:hypothetical protein
MNAEKWTISEEEVEDLAEKANAAAEAAINGTWGMFVYADGSAAIGGGSGRFLWFSSKAPLLKFIANHLTFWVPGPSGIDPGRIWSEVKKIVVNVESDDLSVIQAIPKLNAVLHQFCRVAWIGTFKDLTVGEGDFERNIRRWFREQEGRDNCDAAITRKEAQAFREAISTYGI